MGLPNLSGSNIQDTYQRVLHTDGNLVHDGTGSALPISFVSGNLNTPNGTLILGPSHGFIKAYGGDESWLSISGPSPSSRITSVSTQLKIADNKGISFGADAHFRIESEEDPDKLIFKTFDHGDFSTTVKLEMDKEGNLTSSADFSSSGDIYGNTLHVGGNITASGDIIVSGSIRSLSNPEDTFINLDTSDGDLDIVNANGRITLSGQGGIELGTTGTTTVSSGSLKILGTLDAGDVFTSELTNGSLTYCTVGQEIHFGAITGSGGPTPLKLFANEVASLVIGVDGNITTIGDITADGTILGLDILSKNNPSSGLKFNSGSTDVLHNLVVTGSITASGNISASGNIVGNRVYPNGLNDAFIGTFGGQIQSSTGFTGANITGSNISASGIITAASFVGNMDGGSF